MPATDRTKLVLAGILLAIPIVALMAVPTYAREDPTLFGFPFPTTSTRSTSGVWADASSGPG